MTGDPDNVTFDHTVPFSNEGAYEESLKLVLDHWSRLRTVVVDDSLGVLPSVYSGLRHVCGFNEQIKSDNHWSIKILPSLRLCAELEPGRAARGLHRATGR